MSERPICPCGNECEIVEHVFGEGELRNGVPARITRHFWRARYFSEASDRDFCSAACSLKWEMLFWWPFRQHLGKAA